MPLSPGLLQPGNNILAAEIRQSSASSSDVAFDLELGIQWLTPGGLANTVPAFLPAPSLVRTGGGAFSFLLPESAGRVYSVESSLNLGSWITEGTFITGPSGLTWPVPSGPVRKYFRARWKPAP